MLRGVSRTLVAVAAIAIVVTAAVAVYFATQAPSPAPTPTLAPTTPTPTLTPTPTPRLTPTPSPTPTLTPTPTPLPTPRPEERPPVTLVVLTRHPTDLVNLAREEFLKSELARKYNVADIQFVALEVGKWREYMREYGADIAWGGGPSPYESLYREGWLLPLTSKEVVEALGMIPETILGATMKRIGPDGKVYWVAQAISGFGILVNTRLLRDYGLPMPEDWRDLVRPEFGLPLLAFGSPASIIANPIRSTSHLRIYQIILESYGWEEGFKYLTLLAANSKIVDSASMARDAVIRGEFAASIAVDYFGYIAMVQNPDCLFIVPLNTVVNGDPIALLNTSKNVEAAQAFIAWTLTEGQRVLLDRRINRLPINPAVWDTPEGRARPDLREIYYRTLSLTPIRFDDEEVMLYEYAFARYFKAVFMDAHDRLVEVWKRLVDLLTRKVITAERFAEYVAKLSAPLKFVDPVAGQEVVFAKEYAMEISPRMRADRTLEERLMSLWTQLAIERYEALMRELQALG